MWLITSFIHWRSYNQLCLLSEWCRARVALRVRALCSLHVRALRVLGVACVACVACTACAACAACSAVHTKDMKC